MTIHNASTANAPQIVALLHRKRQQYQPYSPIFWRMADRPADAQEPPIRRLVDNVDVTASSMTITSHYQRPHRHICGCPTRV